MEIGGILVGRLLQPHVAKELDHEPLLLVLELRVAVAVAHQFLPTLSFLVVAQWMVSGSILNGGRGKPFHVVTLNAIALPSLAMVLPMEEHVVLLYSSNPTKHAAL